MGTFIEKFKIKEKLRIIFTPFLVLELFSIALFTFLRCFFSDKLSLLHMNEDTLDYWILPFIAPLPPILFWLLPKMLRFYLPNKISGYQSLYSILFFLDLTLGLVALPIQDYCITMTGRLTKLNTINQISELGQTKYYTLKNYYIDKRNGSAFKTEKAQPRGGVEMLIYIALPIFESPYDTMGKEVKAWLGISYQDSRGSLLSEAERKNKFRSFAEKSQIDFNNKNVQQFDYLERIGNTNDHNGFNQAIMNNKKFRNGNDLVLIPVNTPYSQRGRMGLIMGIFIATLGTFFSLLLTLTLMFGTLNEEAMVKYLSKGKTS